MASQPALGSGSKKVKELLRQQRNRCPLCGNPAKPEECNIDHKIPRSKGGTNRQRNLQAVHVTCNDAKANGEPIPRSTPEQKKERYRRKYERRDQRRALVLYALRAFPDGVVVSRLAALTGIDVNHLQLILRNVQRRGEVECVPNADCRLVKWKPAPPAQNAGGD